MRISNDAMNEFVFLQVNSMTILICRKIGFHVCFNQCCGLCPCKTYLLKPSLPMWLLGNTAVKAVIKVLQGPKGGPPADRTPGLIGRETGGGGQKPWSQVRRGEATLPGSSPADPEPRWPASRMRSRHPRWSPGLASSGSQGSWKQSEEKQHRYTLMHYHSAWESMKHCFSQLCMKNKQDSERINFQFERYDQFYYFPNYSVPLMLCPNHYKTKNHLKRNLCFCHQ